MEEELEKEKNVSKMCSSRSKAAFANIIKLRGRLSALLHGVLSLTYDTSSTNLHEMVSESLRDVALRISKLKLDLFRWRESAIASFRQCTYGDKPIAVTAVELYHHMTFLYF